ncbi:MAG TPA: hypothetical protein VK047_00175 [Zeimonas sp.]|nr:hypothetical protein [Zeimonas sp.]
MLAASLASLTLVPGDALRALRFAMLWFGLPLLALAMTLAASAARRLARDVDAREILRLRERLYFVAALVLTVLVPSALLGLRAALVPRPGGALAVGVVEAGAWLLAAGLLWGNVGDARGLGVAGDPGQRADESASVRSMSSMR